MFDTAVQGRLACVPGLLAPLGSGHQKFRLRTRGCHVVAAQTLQSKFNDGSGGDRGGSETRRPTSREAAAAAEYQRFRFFRQQFVVWYSVVCAQAGHLCSSCVAIE